MTDDALSAAAFLSSALGRFVAEGDFYAIQLGRMLSAARAEGFGQAQAVADDQARRVREEMDRRSPGHYNYGVWS